MKHLIILLWLVAPWAQAQQVNEETPPTVAIMTAADLQQFLEPEPLARIAYGDDPLQFGDLRLPPGEGPHPVMLLIHGGCWLSQYDIGHIGYLADAFSRAEDADVVKDKHREKVAADQSG